MNNCIVTDFDGTLADLSHRLHYVKGKKRNYDAFFDEVATDTPINEVIEVVNLLSLDYTIFVVSARSDVCREASEKWLEDHNVVHDYFLMRKEGDCRRDTIVKQEMLNQIEEMGYWPVMAFDDRRTVCTEVWRANGIRTFEVDDWEEKEHRVKMEDNPAILHVMVGPSGSGKSTFAHKLFKPDQIISSDRIREEICEEMQDQSKNDEVFKILHSLVKHRLEMGLDAVVDATNIRNKDRKEVAALANGGQVVYHVINREMDEKVRDGGWRNKVDGLLERHENTFKSNLKDILKGDGMDNVKVVDHREDM